MLTWALGALGATVVGILVVVKAMYGGGRAYPDLSTTPLVPAARLEVLAETALPPGNVACAPDGRIFYDLHPFAEPGRFTDSFVYELEEGGARPFPDREVQAELRGVLGMTVDRQNRLWMIRPAGIEKRPTRLFAIDLASRSVVLDYVFEDGAAPFAQDLRVAPDGRTVYLADTGIFRFTPAALIVFDVETRTARRVLEGHASVSPQDWVIRTKDGFHRVLFGLVTFAVGVDGLTLSHDGDWLYYATMSHDSVYRIATRHLRDTALSERPLAAFVEYVGRKPLSDGIEIDDRDNLYITDVENGGIARLSPRGELETLVRDDRIWWADGIALTPDGALLFTDSEIPAYIDQLLRPPARSRVDRAAPHALYRVKLPADEASPILMDPS